MAIPKPIRRLIFHTALSFLGADVRETPDGSNAGPFIDLMKKEFGGGENWAWCMYFVQWCVLHAYEIYGHQRSPLAIYVEPHETAYDPDFKIDLDAPNGHVYSIWHHALRQDAFDIITTDELIQGREAPLGSIWVRYDESRKGHTGIVVNHAVDSENPRQGIIRSIEGNTSNGVNQRDHVLRALIDKGLQGVIT